jgi:hypothetical protein
MTTNLFVYVIVKDTFWRSELIAKCFLCVKLFLFFLCDLVVSLSWNYV